MATVRWSFCLSFGQQEFLPWIPSLPSLYLTAESWPLTLTETSEAFSSLDDVVDSFLPSWMNYTRIHSSRNVAFMRNLPSKATPGKAHCCSKFSPFVDNDPYCGSLKSQSLRSGFVTFYRQIDVIDFVSQLFLSIVAWLTEIFQPTSLCQTASI